MRHLKRCLIIFVVVLFLGVVAVPAKVHAQKYDTITETAETRQNAMETPKRVGIVTAQSAVRVREKASTESEQIASMESGDTFLVLEEETATDGYVWYKIELDDNGTIVNGYVRSDLVSVEEIEREEDVQVQSEAPTVESTIENESAPYCIVSQKSVTGKTKWYLVVLENGDTTEIEFLLSGGAATLREKVNVGIYKCLILVAVCVAINFYKRWREALREAKMGNTEV